MRRVVAVGAAGVIEGVLDLVLPKRCVKCRASGSWLCEPCALALQALPADRCPRCGAPRSRAAVATTWRAADAAPGARRPSAPCRECRGRDLAFTSASAAFVYEGPARALVTAASSAPCARWSTRWWNVPAPHSAQPAPVPWTPPTPHPRRRFSSPGSPPIATTPWSGVSTRRSCWRAGLRGAPASPMLRFSAGDGTAPARAGWIAPHGRRTSVTLSRCGRMLTGY